MKIKLTICITILMLCILTGCSLKKHSLNDTKIAGELLIYEIAYQNKEKEFSDTFESGKNLHTSFTKSAQNIQNDFLTDLTDAGVSVTKDQKEEFLKIFHNNLLNQTEFFTLSDDSKSSDNSAKLLIRIFGVDYVTSIKEATDEILAKLVNDTKLASDRNKVNELIIQSLLSHLEKAKKTTKPIETSIDIFHDSTKWYLKEDQTNKIKSIYLSFLTNHQSNDELLQNIKKQMQQLETVYSKKVIN